MIRMRDFLPVDRSQNMINQLHFTTVMKRTKLSDIQILRKENCAYLVVCAGTWCMHTHSWFGVWHVCDVCHGDVVCVVMWFVVFTVWHGIRCGVCLWCGVKYALVCCSVWCGVVCSVLLGEVWWDVCSVDCGLWCGVLHVILCGLWCMVCNVWCTPHTHTQKQHMSRMGCSSYLTVTWIYSQDQMEIDQQNCKV